MRTGFPHPNADERPVHGIRRCFRRATLWPPSPPRRPQRRPLRRLRPPDQHRRNGMQTTGAGGGPQNGGSGEGGPQNGGGGGGPLLHHRQSPFVDQTTLPTTLSRRYGPDLGTSYAIAMSCAQYAVTHTWAPLAAPPRPPPGTGSTAAPGRRKNDWRQPQSRRGQRN